MDQEAKSSEDFESSEDFPEITVKVAPISDRSRATLAKTHHRPAVADFSAIFSSK